MSTTLTIKKVLSVKVTNMGAPNRPSNAEMPIDVTKTLSCSESMSNVFVKDLSEKVPEYTLFIDTMQYKQKGNTNKYFSRTDFFQNYTKCQKSEKWLEYT